MTIEKAFPAMGTVHTITIFDAEGPGAANDALAKMARKETDKALNAITLIASEGMKDGYDRADN